MKPVYCKECGDEIQNSYAVNPTNSDICENCYANKVEYKEADDFITMPEN